MPVTFGELSTLTTPLSVARFWALLFGCLAFSLAAVTNTSEYYLNTFHTFCMATWCIFFILTFFIVAINFVQFHSLLPLSWKNLTATVSALGMLMTMAATFAFPWILVQQKEAKPREVAAIVGSFLSSLGYMVELQLIRSQDSQQQRGYMASVPGLLKVLQVFGGCVALVLMVPQKSEEEWRIGISATVYSLCLAASLGTVLVMVGDCAGRCPVPFDRLLAGFSTLGVLLYMVATVICITRVLSPPNDIKLSVLMSETVIASITLLAYTVDLAFSVKLLCDRN
ncbi:myeloid-associated differentiation marker homolog [Colossoma macropomum]|uniref:myeloid-associated differentiation marker homolog n=1 Tax=Colossoma macropomum TaxID=42526 RepID=UPI0018640A34|nr:myeloid-associated differentiation marker homolog [Colossoma macropomum]